MGNAVLKNTFIKYGVATQTPSISLADGHSSPQRFPLHLPQLGPKQPQSLNQFSIKISSHQVILIQKKRNQ